MISAIRIIADIIFSYPSLFPNLSNKYSILKAFISIRQKKASENFTGNQRNN